LGCKLFCWVGCFFCAALLQEGGVLQVWVV
jgi:hypothetical protein